MKKSIEVKSEYTTEELKKYYLLGCKHEDETCNWVGLSKDSYVVENDDDTFVYVCPNCNRVLTIIK